MKYECMKCGKQIGGRKEKQKHSKKPGHESFWEK